MKHFQDLKFSPPVSNAFPLTKQNSPKWDPPLSVQEGFDISFLKYYFLPLLNIIGYQLIKYFGNTKFWNWWWCGPFALGSCSLPLWHKSPKTESLEPSQTTFSPLANKIWVKIIPKTERCSEWRRRMSYGVEAFVFAEDSNSLSIYLWLGLK